MSMKKASHEEPTLQFLAHRINQWLEEDPRRTQLQFAQTVVLPDGTHPSRPTISNLISGAQGASYTMVKAVAAALGLSPESLEREAGEWWAEQKKVREAEAAQARSKRGVKGHDTSPAPTKNLAVALAHAGEREPVDPTIAATLAKVSAELPRDLRLATWLLMLEDLTRA